MSATGCTCGHVIDNHRFRWDQTTGAARHGGCIIPGCPCTQWTPADPTWPPHLWSGKQAAQALAAENERLRKDLEQMTETLNEQSALLRRQTAIIGRLHTARVRIANIPPPHTQSTPCPRCTTPDPKLCTESLPYPPGNHTHCPKLTGHRGGIHGNLAVMWR